MSIELTLHYFIRWQYIMIRKSTEDESTDKSPSAAIPTTSKGLKTDGSTCTYFTRVEVERGHLRVFEDSLLELSIKTDLYKLTCIRLALSRARWLDSASISSIFTSPHFQTIPTYRYRSSPYSTISATNTYIPCAMSDSLPDVRCWRRNINAGSFDAHLPKTEELLSIGGKQVMQNINIKTLIHGLPKVAVYPYPSPYTYILIHILFAVSDYFLPPFKSQQPDPLINTSCWLSGYHICLFVRINFSTLLLGEFRETQRRLGIRYTASLWWQKCALTLHWKPRIPFSRYTFDGCSCCMKRKIRKLMNKSFGYIVGFSIIDRHTFIQKFRAIRVGFDWYNLAEIKGLHTQCVWEY